MTTQGVPVPNFGSQNANLPFTIQYSSFPTSQLNCQNNINAIPNGPVFPTKPVFPSSLPPSLSQFPSTLQTNFINVKREACICSLRTSNLIVDSGFSNSTFLQIKNIPDLEMNASKKYFNLVSDESGRVFRKEIKRNGQTASMSNFESISNSNSSTSINNDMAASLNFGDPLFAEEF